MEINGSVCEFCSINTLKKNNPPSPHLLVLKRSYAVDLVVLSALHPLNLHPVTPRPVFCLKREGQPPRYRSCYFSLNQLFKSHSGRYQLQHPLRHPVPRLGDSETQRETERSRRPDRQRDESEGLCVVSYRGSISGLGLQACFLQICKVI